MACGKDLMMKLSLCCHLLLIFALPLMNACGQAPEPYYPTSSGVTPAVAESSTGGSQTSTVKGTKVTTPSTAKPGGTSSQPAPAAAKPPAGAPAANNNNAALVQQGTQIYSSTCATAGCHAAIGQKANDPRVNAKTAAQLTAAKTTKPAPHAAVTWPNAAGIMALEAALK